MEEFIRYIFKNLPGVIALLGIVVTILYYLIELPNIEISNIIKSPIGKGSLTKIVISVIIIAVTVLVIDYAVGKEVKFDDIAVQLIIVAIIPFIVLVLFAILHNKEKNLLFSREDMYAFRKKKKARDKQLITKSELIQIFTYLMIILGCVILIKQYCLYIWDENDKTRFIVGVVVLFEIGLIFFASGYVLSWNNLRSLKKYIIKTDQFENGYVKALIITETESQLYIKCEKSYPIILNKSEVKAYISIDYLSDDEVNNLIEDRIGEDNYEGYYLAKEKSGVNDKY